MKHAYVIILGILSYLFATDIYTPSMPDIAHYFNETSDEVQRTISFFLFGSVITCIVSGIFADRYGKKKFLVSGMVIALMGSILTIFATSLEWLILGRFIQGIGGGVATVIGFSVIQELYDEEKQSQIYGIMGVLLAGIPAVAPFLGGVISAYFGWHVIFALMGIMFAVSSLCMWLYLPESLNKPIAYSSIEILKSYKQILTSRAFLAIALVAPLYCSVEWFYITYLPFYMQEKIGVSAELYGFYLGITFLCFALGSYIGGKLMKAFGTDKAIKIGLYSGLLSGVVLWVIVFAAPLSMFWIFASLGIFFTVFGVLFPSTISASMSFFKNAKTRASSIRSLFITAFAFLGSFNAEWVDDSNLSHLAAYVSVCCILAMGLYGMRSKTAN